MNVADFHTAPSRNLPLRVFVFNDNPVGQERHDRIPKVSPPNTLKSLSRIPKN